MRGRGRVGRGGGAVALAVLLVVGVLAGTVLAGCAAPAPGRAVAATSVTAGVDPSFLRGTDGGEDDRVAAATLRDLGEWWGRAFPPLAGGRPFEPPAGLVSVDSAAETGDIGPCLREPREVEGNAFYCPRADTITFDRVALVPVLRDEFGDTAVVAVLAHEYGHAVQNRLGTDPRAPEILLEAQADCYGGAFLRQVRDGTLPDLRTGDDGVDAAMAALVTFRDPVGTGATAADAHGNAFDRVASFQTGFDGGPAPCAATTLDNRRFTQRTFSTLSEQRTGGNVALDDLLPSAGGDLAGWAGGVVAARRGPWTPPATVRGPAVCPGDDGAVQGPIAFCPADRTLHLDTATLAGDHRRLGDFATATRLASRYGLAILAALDRPTTGPDAGRAALCLAGAWTGSLDGTRPTVLSPGDLDEAVALLLRSDDAARAADGAVGSRTGYDRVADLRRGVDGGPDACLAPRA